MVALSLKDQIARVRHNALVVPAPELAVFVVTGADRLSWLNGMLTCDLATRKPGDAVYGLAVAQKGRILSDVIVVVDVDRVLLAVARMTTAPLAESLERYLMMEDALVTPAFETFGVWHVHGPESAAVLEAARAAGGVGGALDRTGLGGAFILADHDKRLLVERSIESAIASASGAMGDDAGWNALRLERGVPRFGADFDASTYPQEASLEKVAVSFSKGCYLGQEVVCMLEMRGHVKRKLMSLALLGGGVPARGAIVKDDSGAPVGEVTSASESPSLGSPVALAMLKFAQAEAGKELLVGDQRARVVDRPA